MNKNDYMINFTTESIACEGDMFYFVAREINILFSYCYSEDKIRMLSIVPDEDRMIERQFISICKCENKLVLSPYHAKKIWMFDINTEVWSSVDISEFINVNEECKFSGCVCFQNKVYFFGYMCPGILMLDMESLELEYIFNYSKDEKQWGQKISIVDNKAYVAYSNKKELCMVDFKSQTASNIKLDVACDGFSSVGFDKKNFILVPAVGDSMYYTEKMDKLVKYDLPEQFKDNIYNGVAVSEKYIYIYSTLGKSYVIDRVNEENSFIEDKKIYYVDYLEDKRFIESRKGLLRFYDENLQVIRNVNFRIDRENLRIYYNGCPMCNIAYRENETFDINMFIDKMINS